MPTRRSVLALLGPWALISLLVVHSSRRLDFPTQTISQTAFAVSTDLAFRQSLGFFDDISDAAWRRIQNISNSRSHKMPRTLIRKPNEYQNAAMWYQHNWDTNFSCLFEEMVGPMGDGHKFVCDIFRLAAIHQRRLQNQQSGCLVYSFGSRGDFRFEQGVLEHAPMCEIHVFDPSDYSSEVPDDRMHYHAWGLRASYNTSHNEARTVNGRHPPAGNYSTLQEITSWLRHEGRVIDILKIDCEGCEWYTFRDWLTVDARQLLVETHQAPPITPRFFQALHNHGYVMTHKEPNLLFGVNGNCVEFSFLKLAKDFFNRDDTF